MPLVPLSPSLPHLPYPPNNAPNVSSSSSSSSSFSASHHATAVATVPVARRSPSLLSSPVFHIPVHPVYHLCVRLSSVPLPLSPRPTLLRIFPPVKTIPYFRTNYQETTLYSATLFINFNNVAGSARISSAEASRQVSRNGNNPLRGTRVLEMDGWKLRTRVRIVDFGSGRARYRVQTFACSCPRLPVKGRETKQSIERPGNVVIVTRRSTAVTRWPHCGR